MRNRHLQRVSMLLNWGTCLSLCCTYNNISVQNRSVVPKQVSSPLSLPTAEWFQCMQTGFLLDETQVADTLQECTKSTSTDNGDSVHRTGLQLVQSKTIKMDIGSSAQAISLLLLLCHTACYRRCILWPSRDCKGSSGRPAETTYLISDFEVG